MCIDDKVAVKVFAAESFSLQYPEPQRPRLVGSH